MLNHNFLFVLRGVVLLIVTAACSRPAAGQAWTWDAGALTNLWSLHDNWADTPPPPPPSSVDTTIEFAGTFGLTPFQNLADPFRLNQLRFLSSAGAFDLRGSPLEFRTNNFGAPPGIQQSSAAAITIQNDLVLTNTVTYRGSGSMTLSGQLSGAGGLVMFGNDMLTLDHFIDGSNYTGALTVNRGILRLNQLTSTFANSPVALRLFRGELQLMDIGGQLSPRHDVTVGGDFQVTMEDTTSGIAGVRMNNLTIGGYELTLAHTGLPSSQVQLSFAGAVTLTGAPTFNLNSEVYLTFIESVVGESGGSFGFTKNGEGLLSLTESTFTGDVLLNAGTIRAFRASSLGVGPAALVLNGGILELIGGGDMPLLRNTTVGGDATLTVRSSTGVPGPYIRTFGSLSIGNSHSLNIERGFTADPASPYDARFSATTLNGTAHFNVVASGSLTLGGVGGTGDLYKEGAGTLVLDGPSTYVGDTLISSGILRLTSHPLPATTEIRIGVTAGTLDLNNLSQTAAGLHGGTGEIVLGSGTLTVNNVAPRTYSGAISGSGGLVKQGLGSLRLEGNLDHTGLTTVEAGTLVISTPSVAGDLSATGGTLRLDGPTTNLGSKSVTAGAGGAVEYDAIGMTGGVLHGPGTHTVVPTGSTTMIGTTIHGSVVLQQNGATTFNNVANHGQLTSDALLTWSGGGNEWSGVLTVNDTANLDHFENRGQMIVNSGGLLRNSITNFDHFDGARLTVNSGGIIVHLGGTSLNLNDSRLVNNGAIAGATNVNAGSIAKGSGMYGPVNVMTGGQFSPGNSPGHVQTGDVVWDDGGRYLFEIADATGTAGAAWDLWDIEGTLIVASGTTTSSRFTIDVVSLLANGVTPGPAADFNPLLPYTWPIVEATGGIIGLSPSKVGIDTTGYISPNGLGDFSLSVAGGTLLLNYSPDSLSGDIDLDGDVDRTDTALFIPYLGLASGAIWATGDFDGDAATTLLDLDLLQSHLGQSPSLNPAGAPVPEPASWALVIFGALALPLAVQRQH